MNEAKELDEEIFKIQQEFWPRKLTALPALNEVNREYRRAIEDACAKAQMATEPMMPLRIRSLDNE